MESPSGRILQVALVGQYLESAPDDEELLEELLEDELLELELLDELRPELELDELLELELLDELEEELLEELAALCFQDARVKACKVSLVKPDIYNEASGAGVELYRVRK